MRIYLNERSAMLPAALAPLAAAQWLPAAADPQLPQLQHAPTQAELIVAPQSVASKGTNVISGGNATSGANGFTGKDVRTANKRMDVRGLPPRGRPV